MKLIDEALKRQAEELKSQAGDVRGQARSAGEPFQSWFTRVELLVRQLGSDGDVFSVELQRLRTPATWQARLDYEQQGRALQIRRPSLNVANEWMVDAASGVLDAIIQALDNGLLHRVEDRVASIIYADVLDEASALLDREHHGCAAVIARSALENGLRRLARREGMSDQDVDAKKASAINDWLRANRNFYTQATQRQVQSWLDPGNAYLHNPDEWTKYAPSDIARTLNEIRGFLGRYGL